MFIGIEWSDNVTMICKKDRLTAPSFSTGRHCLKHAATHTHTLRHLHQSATFEKSSTPLYLSENNHTPSLKPLHTQIENMKTEPTHHCVFKTVHFSLSISHTHSHSFTCTNTHTPGLITHTSTCFVTRAHTHRLSFVGLSEAVAVSLTAWQAWVVWTMAVLFLLFIFLFLLAVRVVIPLLLFLLGISV